MNAKHEADLADVLRQNTEVMGRIADALSRPQPERSADVRAKAYLDSLRTADPEALARKAPTLVPAKSPRTGSTFLAEVVENKVLTLREYRPAPVADWPAEFLDRVPVKERSRPRVKIIDESSPDFGRLLFDIPEDGIPGETYTFDWAGLSPDMQQATVPFQRAQLYVTDARDLVGKPLPASYVRTEVQS